MINLLFMGRKQIAAETLLNLSQNPLVNIVGVLTDSHLLGSPTTEVAKNCNLPLFTFEEALVALDHGDLEFDLGVSVLYWRKLRDGFLRSPRLGVINFHPAPLPMYKGTGGYNIAILEGLEKWGVTAHYVDSEIDTGEIIKISEFSIDCENELCTTLEAKSMQAMRALIDDVLDSTIASGERLKSYPNIGGRYVSRLEMEAMKKVQPGEDVSRKSRAFWFPPYDGAYIEIDGEKYTLVSSQILNSLSPPGTTSLFSSNQ